MIGGETSVPSELREYTAASPNLIKFLMGSSALNFHLDVNKLYVATLDR